MFVCSVLNTHGCMHMCVQVRMNCMCTHVYTPRLMPSSTTLLPISLRQSLTDQWVPALLLFQQLSTGVTCTHDHALCTRDQTQVLMLGSKCSYHRAISLPLQYVLNTLLVPKSKICWINFLQTVLVVGSQFVIKYKIEGMILQLTMANILIFHTYLNGSWYFTYCVLPTDRQVEKIIPQ